MTRREQTQRYYKKHHTRLLVKARTYYKNHTDEQKEKAKKRNAAMREYLRTHPEARAKKYAANNEESRRRRLERKLKAVAYKGSKCSVCGYDTCLDALEFHHVNPKEKEVGISQMAEKVWDKHVEELNKCILLCANCHREAHARDARFLTRTPMNAPTRRI